MSTVLKHYWQCWKAESLVDLREFHKMRKGQKGLPVDIKEGDIVSVRMKEGIIEYFGSLVGLLS